MFIVQPWEFYKRVENRAVNRGLYVFVLCLITAPCMNCGEPMKFTHELENYDRVKEVLRKALKPKAVVFDLGGDLIDSSERYSRCLCEVIGKDDVRHLEDLISIDDTMRIFRIASYQKSSWY